MKILLIFLVMTFANNAQAWLCADVPDYDITVCTTQGFKDGVTFWYQPKAACFSYYDVMNDETGEWCSANFADCNRARNGEFTSQDYRNVTACSAKGSRP
jgi:hypothetical protein